LYEKFAWITNNLLGDFNRYGYRNGQLVFMRHSCRVAGETAQEIRVEENVVLAMKKALSRLKTKAGAFFDTVGFSIAWFKISIMKKE